MRRAYISFGVCVSVALALVVFTRDWGKPAPAERALPTTEHGSGETVQIADYAEPKGDGWQARSDWARALYAADSSPGPYIAGESSDTRPFDDSDPEMQRLMRDVYAVGGCAQPGQPCLPALDLLRQGGDRLASYLIRQLEESERGGWPNNDTYLSYIASTRSETGYRFVRGRVLNRSKLSPDDQSYAVHMLGKTGHPEAIDIALGLLGDSDAAVQSAACNVLWKVSIDRNELRPDVVEVLVDLREKGWVNAKAGIVNLNKHFGRNVDE